MKYIEKKEDNTIYRIIDDCLVRSSDYDKSTTAKNLLLQMYHNSCTFCESTPSEGCYMQIEHFYPKNHPIWSAYRKNIKNLHISCPVCNTLKGTTSPKFFLSPNYRIKNNKWENLDEVSSSIHYCGPFLYVSKGIPKKLRRRTKSTIQKLRLNTRPSLVESRLRVFANACELIEVLDSLLRNYCKANEPSIKIIMKLLIEMTSPHSHYSSMILQNFGNTILTLLLIWKQQKKTRT